MQLPTCYRIGLAMPPSVRLFVKQTFVRHCKRFSETFAHDSKTHPSEPGDPLLSTRRTAKSITSL